MSHDTGNNNGANQQGVSLTTPKDPPSNSQVGSQVRPRGRKKLRRREVNTFGKFFGRGRSAIRGRPWRRYKPRRARVKEGWQWNKRQIEAVCGVSSRGRGRGRRRGRGRGQNRGRGFLRRGGGYTRPRLYRSENRNSNRTANNGQATQQQSGQQTTPKQT